MIATFVFIVIYLFLPFYYCIHFWNLLELSNISSLIFKADKYSLAAHSTICKFCIIARMHACVENRQFPNEMHHQVLGSMKPHAECCPGSDDAPSWEICNFCMGMGSCFYPMTSKKFKASHAEIAQFCTPLFCTNCVLVMG